MTGTYLWQAEMFLSLTSLGYAKVVIFQFLGAFAKLRKTTFGFVMSVCPSARPSIRMDQLGPNWMDFHEILYLNIFRKTVEKIQVPLKSDKNKRYFT